MRIEIKTVGRVRDNDVRALLLIRKAMEISTPRMRRANLDFVLSRDWSEFDRGWPQTCERVYNPLPK